MAAIAGFALAVTAVTTALNLGHSLEIAAYRVGALVTGLVLLTLYYVTARRMPEASPWRRCKLAGSVYLGGAALSVVAQASTSELVLRRLISEALTWPVFLPLRLVDLVWG